MRFDLPRGRTTRGADKGRFPVPIQFIGRLFAAIMLCLVLAGPALAGQWLGLAVPDGVGVGKPFMARISSIYPMDDLAVTWNGETVHPVIRRNGERFEADVMLGTGLKHGTGIYPLVLDVHLWCRDYRFFHEIAMVESTWGRETLRVAPDKVRPPKKALARIKRERKLMRAAIRTISPERYWEFPFTRPAKGKMLSRFGLYRVFNGDVKARHTGLDFRAWQGTPLYAMAAGKVILTGGFYFAGNAVFIDHGNGLVSMACHMSKILVREGDMVKAGQRIGLSGATGRVTGAHLHLGVFVLGKTVDPELLFDGSLESEFNEEAIIPMDNE
jgi:hypothetical protein